MSLNAISLVYPAPNGAIPRRQPAIVPLPRNKERTAPAALSFDFLFTLRQKNSRFLMLSRQRLRRFRTMNIPPASRQGTKEYQAHWGIRGRCR